MAYVMGSDRRAGEWESSHIGVSFVYSKPEHPRLLDVELEASGFDEKWMEWEKAKNEMFAELAGKVKEAGGSYDGKGMLETLEELEEDVAEDWFDRWLGLRREITSEDVEPLLEFIEEHVIEVGGVTDGEGVELTDWPSFPPRGRQEILRDLPPHEVAALFSRIKRSASLPSKKKSD